MPELPEVEITKLGLEPFVVNRTIEQVVVREPRLRFPIENTFAKNLQGQYIERLSRRGKYLLFHTPSGTLITHLGMSGCFRIVDEQRELAKHDHIDLHFSENILLRYNDPRRFGFMLWTELPAEKLHNHVLFAHLGPEPFSKAYHSSYLHNRAKNKTVNVKTFLMNNETVVGIGNIYATETLFAAKINPLRAAKDLDESEWNNIIKHSKAILKNAIKMGGTTLKDFRQTNGKPGYFKLSLKAYGREGLPCQCCETRLEHTTISGRATVYCPACQR